MIKLLSGRVERIIVVHHEFTDVCRLNAVVGSCNQLCVREFTLGWKSTKICQGLDPATTAANIARVEVLVMQEKRRTVNINNHTGISNGTVEILSSERLKLSKINLRWVYRQLNGGEKRLQFQVAF